MEKEKFKNSTWSNKIFSKITNATNEGKTIEVLKGQGFVQGIFIPFGITIDDEANEERIGGFGSTTK